MPVVAPAPPASPTRSISIPREAIVPPLAPVWLISKSIPETVSDPVETSPVLSTSICNAFIVAAVVSV